VDVYSVFSFPSLSDHKTGRGSLVLVTHSCNLSYSGARDQEDCGSKPAWENSSQDPIWKKPITKKGLVEWLKVYAPSTGKKKTKQKKPQKKPPRGGSWLFSGGILLIDGRELFEKHYVHHTGGKGEAFFLNRNI
jgi:hypothetical protein